MLWVLESHNFEVWKSYITFQLIDKKFEIIKEKPKARWRLFFENPYNLILTEADGAFCIGTSLIYAAYDNLGIYVYVN